MKLDLQVSEVFGWNYDALNDADIRFIINQGGSRSSKSYSICQLLIVYSMSNPNKVVSIIRKSFPSLRGSIYRDFFEIMNNLGLYDERSHNKTENIYKFPNGSIVEFFSADDSQKLRGRKRDVAYCNEANELTFEDFQQLNMRTNDKLFFDFNPSDNYSWLYDIINNTNSVLIKSTYKNNPFLQETLIKEIENLINVDEGYYKVYALGERANLKQTIFTHYKIGEYLKSDNQYYGLDIGYNHPTALSEVSFNDDVLYVKELLYKSNLTSGDLIQQIDELNLSKSKEIVVDNARPDIIEDLRRAGYNAIGANKAVKEGILAVKSYEMIVDRDSYNLIKELSNYKWQMKGDQVLDEPVKLWDDLCDSVRYAVFFHYNKNKTSKWDYDFGFTTVRK